MADEQEGAIGGGWIEGNALKAVGETNEELRVANYLILFGGADSRDLEGIASPHKNQDGSLGEYFTAKTALESSYTDTGRLYVDWEHGQDPDAESPGRDDVLGYVDWGTVKADSRGVWAERVLNRRNAYMRWVEQLVEEGVFGTSTEAVQSGIEKGDDGEIKAWPLRRDTLTVTPMEPRMMSENALAAMKGLSEAFPNVKALAMPAAGLEVQPEESGKGSVDTTAAAVTVNINVSGATVETDPDPVPTPAEEATLEAKTMSEKEEVQAEAPKAPVVDYEAMIQKAVDQAVETTTTKVSAAVDEAWQKKLEEAGPVNSVGVAITDSRADRALKETPFKSLGEMLMCVKTGAQTGVVDTRLLPIAGKDGFDIGKALGASFVGSIAESARKAPTGLSEGLPSAGGFLVSQDEDSSILARVYAVGELLQRANMHTVSAGSNSMVFYGEDETSRADGSRRGGIRAYNQAEAGSYTASSPKFRQIELRLKKYTGLVYCTDELLQDTSVLESYILRNLPEELRFKVEDDMVNGTGVGMLLGVTASPAKLEIAKETGQADATVEFENLTKMWARLWSRSRASAIWMIDQTVLPQLMEMTLDVGTGGMPVYLPPGGASAAPYGTIFGRPVIEHEYGAAVGTVGDIMLIDWGEYMMIEKGGIESASSIHVAFTTGEQVYRFTYRCDGQHAWNSALTPKSGGGTQSPIITLAARP